MNRPALRAAAEREAPLVTPLAHDALSARLIERAGFRAFAIGGSAILAARHAFPDIGLVGLADMAAGIRDIAAATPLPFLADGDDGYGDLKSVVRTVRTYESLGVGGILIEDQERERKQQRAERAQGVVDEAVIEQKLRAGVDGVFIAGIKSAEHYERVGCELKGTFLLAAMFEGGDTPWLTPRALGEIQEYASGRGLPAS